MMAQSRAESTRDTYNYGQYLNQFPPNTIKVIREFERIQKKICRHKMSIMFNEICIYIYIYIYIYIIFNYKIDIITQYHRANTQVSLYKHTWNSFDTINFWYVNTSSPEDQPCETQSHEFLLFYFIVEKLYFSAFSCTEHCILQI